MSHAATRHPTPTDPTMPDPALPLKMPQYFVVPRQIQGGVVSCDYYDNQNNKIGHDQLDAYGQGYSGDFLCLTLRKPSSDDPLAGATLLAGVAKTFGGTCGMQNLFLADAQGRLLLPVMPGATRGLILVFVLPNANGTPGQLVSTADPEIKNTSNGQVGGRGATAVPGR